MRDAVNQTALLSTTNFLRAASSERATKTPVKLTQLITSTRRPYRSPLSANKCKPFASDATSYCWWWCCWWCVDVVIHTTAELAIRTSLVPEQSNIFTHFLFSVVSMLTGVWYGGRARGLCPQNFDGPLGWPTFHMLKRTHAADI